MKLFDDERYYSVQEVSTILGCSKDTIYKRLKKMPQLSRAIHGLKRARLYGKELNKMFYIECYES